MTQPPEKNFPNFPCEVCHNQWCKCIAEEFTLSSPEKEVWEKSVREMFVVGNMRFSGLSNDKLTPEKLIDFIRQLLTSTREEATALARREERERINKLIPIDSEAKLGGLLNFASWGVTDEVSAFQEGFKRGYTCHTDECLKLLADLSDNIK